LESGYFFFRQANQIGSFVIESDFQGLSGKASRGIVAITVKSKGSRRANLSKPASKFQVIINALHIENLFFRFRRIDSTGMPSLRKGLKRRLPIQCTGGVLEVEKEYPRLQTVLERGQISKGLSFKGLSGDGLVMAFNPRMLQGWPFVDEANLHAQSNQRCSLLGKGEALLLSKKALS